MNHRGIRLFLFVLLLALLVIGLTPDDTALAQSQNIPNFIWPNETLSLAQITGHTENVSASPNGVSGDIVVYNNLDLWLHVSTSGAQANPTGVFSILGLLPPGGKATYNTNFTLVGQGVLVTAQYDETALLFNVAYTFLNIAGGGALDSVTFFL